ncbi:MAG: translation initiation factor IF-2 [Patescibacteria group bacterium]
MNISTLAKILGVSINELREVGQKNKIQGFNNRNTRVSYNSAVEITKVVRPDKVNILKNDDKIYLPAALTVQEFSETIQKPVGLIVKTLMMNGIMATINEKIDYDTATIIAEELNVEVHPESEELAMMSSDEDLSLIKSFDASLDEGSMVPRPPVVTVMGHVDHGKTTLLDTIRKTNVVAGEAGAITQHISSYQIEYPSKTITNDKALIKGKKGYKVTFIDTPGHEAFTSMRARGTQLADIIILMVSAVEGPKPQTVEVIERAKMTKTPVIVAVNKIDLPNADVDKVKQEVAAFGIVPEEWGGDSPFVEISAKNNVNIDKLLDQILLLAEINEYKGPINVQSEAVVLESVMDSKAGAQATVLILKGELNMGDIITCGGMQGKIKRILDSDTKPVSKGLVAEPVTIYGLPNLPLIGDLMVVHNSVKEANNHLTAQSLKKSKKKTIMHSKESNDETLNIILKTDVAGSLEALKEAILKIPSEKSQIIIKSESIGQVTESDVDYAKTTGSTILAFHTAISTPAVAALKSQKVDLIESDIIYEILEWVEEEVLKRIKHEIKVEVLGQSKILAVFKSPKTSIQIFGGEVLSGKMLSSKSFRIVRGDEVLGNIEVTELQKNKSATNEVNISQQFGVSATGKIKVQIGDILECINEIVVR